MKIDRRRGSHDNNGLFDLPEVDFEEQCMLIAEAKILQFEDGQYLTTEDVFHCAPMNGGLIKIREWYYEAKKVLLEKGRKCRNK